MRFPPVVVILAVSPAWAQANLSLAEAVRQALAGHPSIEARAAQEKAAEMRVDQARGERLPRLNYAESFQRSDNPVFVFSSLLTQHQFTGQNFALGPLNRPDFLNNFQSQVSVDQTVYDGGQTKAHIRSAELGRQVTEEQARRTRMEAVARVVRAYYDSTLAAEFLRVAREAAASAEADLRRAGSIRTAGMSTDADVLSIRVHLAAMREQEIQRSYGVQVARAALNEALGLPMDTAHTLTTSLTPAAAPVASQDELAKTAAAQRPEMRYTQISSQLAESQAAAVRAALLPQVSLRGAFEADRQRFVDRGGANWFVGASLRWNLFNGFSDRARIAEAEEVLRGARAQARHVGGGIGLEVRRAYADWNAAQERIAVASAAVAMAEESLRITKNRYEGGLATVTDLLRNETAHLAARTRHLAAIGEQRVAAVELELAAGTLSPDSPALQ